MAGGAQGTFNPTNLPEEQPSTPEHLKMPLIHSIPTATAAGLTAEMRTLHQFNK